MTDNKLPLTPARVEQVPYIQSGAIVTQAGTEYYVYEEYRGNLELVRLSDLKDGYRANVTRHNVKVTRMATEAERGRVMGMKLEKLEADAKFRPGALVKAAKNSKHMEPGALYVITKCSEKTVSVVILGGTNTGAYVNAPRALLTIVDPADVLK